MYWPLATTWLDRMPQRRPRRIREVDGPAANPSQSLIAIRSALVSPDGREVQLTGASWFGMETGAFAPHGLWARNWQEMLDQIVQTGFNTLRLPYSNQLLDPATQPNGIDYHINPDLQGLTGLDLLDRVIQGAGQRDLRVILDRHRPDAGTQSALWYTDHVPEEKWIQDWVLLAQRYRGDPTVIGADLHNEPHNPATWGDGNPSTDWRLAAERAGNAILAVNPDWLIVVQGVQQFGDTWACWGGNLAGARAYPVRLTQPEKLVYSPHDFGPSISWQPWFSAPNFPANLAGTWQERWAYLRLEDIAPLWLGEFGARSVGQDVEGVWQRTLVAYLKEHGISYAYWAWNPDSGDTGGILEGDWRTVNQAKMDILSAYQAPLLR
jgi:endoglucanase